MLNTIKKIFTREDQDWKKFKQEAEHKALFTPDLALLQQQARWPVFVYNELQQGQVQNLRMSKSIYRGLGYTKTSDFVMYKKLLGKETYPLAMAVSEDQKFGISSLIGDMGQIMGELYSVTPYDIIQLDEYHLNTVSFERKTVPILIPYKADAKADKFDMYEREAFMYIGRPEFFNEQIFSSEGKKLFAYSQRLFVTKENKDEPLGAYYVFDHNLEAHKE